MEISQELIQKFFNKQCAAEEAAIVSTYLKNNPEILDIYLNKQEWDETQTKETKPKIFWSEIWDDIQQNKVTRPKVIWLKRIAVAASIIGLLSITAWWFIPGKSVLTNNQITSAFIHRSIQNTGKMVKQVLLKDGSIVQLYPNSVLDYDEPFQNNKRELHLNGEAIFKVAKDKTKPFIVHSGILSTTALGTTFKVKSFENALQIMVHLYEGKVVVKTTKTKDTYLAPGDELIYDKEKMLATLHSAAKMKPANRADHQPEAQWLTFRKTALSSVFDQLASKYNRHIEYSNNDIEQLYFIGNFEKTDSLENILKAIAQLNNLKVERNQAGGFIITK